MGIAGHRPTILLYNQFNFPASLGVRLEQRARTAATGGYSSLAKRASTQPCEFMRSRRDGRRGCDKITRRAEFRFRRRANHFLNSEHPVPKEGALAIVTNVGTGCGGRGGIVRAM